MRTRAHIIVTMINVATYPQLKLLAWNRPWDTTLGEDEAFALYESNWRFVDQDTLVPAERTLIETLVAKFGGGLLNV